MLGSTGNRGFQRGKSRNLHEGTFDAYLCFSRKLLLISSIS